MTVTTTGQTRRTDRARDKFKCKSNDIEALSFSFINRHKEGVKDNGKRNYINDQNFLDEKIYSSQFDFSGLPVFPISEGTYPDYVSSSGQGSYGSYQFLNNRVSNDYLEKDADRLSAQVNDQSLMQLKKSNNSLASSLKHHKKSRILPSTRAFFEDKYKHNFDRIMVHTDDVAGRLTDELNSLAVTIGRDIFFAEGAFDQDSLSGLKLLSHELVHIMQNKKIGSTNYVLTNGKRKGRRSRKEKSGGSRSVLVDANILISLKNIGVNYLRQIGIHQGTTLYVIEANAREARKKLSDNEWKAFKRRYNIRVIGDPKKGTSLFEQITSRVLEFQPSPAGVRLEPYGRRPSSIHGPSSPLEGAQSVSAAEIFLEGFSELGGETIAPQARPKSKPTEVRHTKLGDVLFALAGEQYGYTMYTSDGPFHGKIQRLIDEGTFKRATLAPLAPGEEEGVKRVRPPFSLEGSPRSSGPRLRLEGFEPERTRFPRPELRSSISQGTSGSSEYVRSGGRSRGARGVAAGAAAVELARIGIDIAAKVLTSRAYEEYKDLRFKKLREADRGIEKRRIEQERPVYAILETEFRVYHSTGHHAFNNIIIHYLDPRDPINIPNKPALSLDYSIKRTLEIYNPYAESNDTIFIESNWQAFIARLARMGVRSPYCFTNLEIPASWTSLGTYPLGRGFDYKKCHEDSIKVREHIYVAYKVLLLREIL